MADHEMIQFPTPSPEEPEEPEAEHYDIDYYPDSHAVDIPLIPDDVMSAVCILAVFMKMLIREGTLSGDEILQVAMQTVDSQP